MDWANWYKERSNERRGVGVFGKNGILLDIFDGSLMKLELMLCLQLRGVFFSRTSEQEGHLMIMKVAKHQFGLVSGIELENLQTLFMKPV